MNFFETKKPSNINEGFGSFDSNCFKKGLQWKDNARQYHN